MYIMSITDRERRLLNQSLEALAEASTLSADAQALQADMLAELKMIINQGWTKEEEVAHRG